VQANVDAGMMAFERFDYPAGPELPAPILEAFAPPVTRPDAAADLTFAPPRVSAEKRIAELEQRIVEEVRRSSESGRERGHLEGRTAEQESQAEARTTQDRQRVEQAARLVDTFAQERERYLHAAEHEVVKLSLSVAARILRREAQMDPLLLSGAVRVALGQLSKSTEVRLHVPAAELDLWSEAMALLPNLPVKPKVLARDGMRLGDRVIETEMGSVDLGVRAQLAEIERGFFDRTGSVPGRAATPAEPREA
jgi:flagellar assembly protein FliH